MESITLTTPWRQDSRAATGFQVDRQDLNWGTQSILIELLDTATNIRRQFTYEGAVAVQLMTALNKLDLSVKSLHRRIIERLVADRKLAGTLQGTPE